MNTTELSTGPYTFYFGVDMNMDGLLDYDQLYSDSVEVNIDPLVTRITTDPSDQFYPAISGDYIVWYDSRNGNYDIYMYDITTGIETQITTDPLGQFNPAISGNRIVWEDSADIYMYDITTGIETKVTTETSHQLYPVISGNRIVGQDNRNGNWDIYMYEVRW